jgi:hypothetical protein
LATEALLNSLRCPTIFVTREPTYVVDSLLSYRGLEAPIWVNERKYILESPQFLARYCPGYDEAIIQLFQHHEARMDDRSRIILDKTLTVALLNRLLRALSERWDFADHVRYEDLCDNPEQTFFRVADFLSLDVGPAMTNYLRSTLEPKQGENGPFTVFRDTHSQLGRPLRYITTGEAEMAQDMLRRVGLG